MQPDVAERLASLRRDFTKVVGRPFKHFVCPILFVDEETELCKAHVVNRAFAASSRRWTLQQRTLTTSLGRCLKLSLLTCNSTRSALLQRLSLSPACTADCVRAFFSTVSSLNTSSRTG